MQYLREDVVNQACMVRVRSSTENKDGLGSMDIETNEPQLNAFGRQTMAECSQKIDPRIKNMLFELKVPRTNFINKVKQCKIHVRGCNVYLFYM